MLVLNWFSTDPEVPALNWSLDLNQGPNDLFNSLDARPEVIAYGCQKEVCQLRSYVSGIDSKRNIVVKIMMNTRTLFIQKSIILYVCVKMIINLWLLSFLLLCGKKNLWFVYSDGFSNNNFEYTLLLCNIAFIHPLWLVFSLVAVKSQDAFLLLSLKMKTAGDVPAVYFFILPSYQSSFHYILGKTCNILMAHHHLEI